MMVHARDWLSRRRQLLAYLLVVLTALGITSVLQQRANDAQNRRIASISAVVCGQNTVDTTKGLVKAGLDKKQARHLLDLCGNPRTGKPGRPGKPGKVKTVTQVKTGRGAGGLSHAQVVRVVRPIVREVVRQEIHTVAGKPGAQGLRGRPGRDGRNGKDGRPGRDGRPGADAHVDVNEIVRQVLARIPNPPPPPDTNAIVQQVLQIVCRRVPTLCS